MFDFQVGQGFGTRNKNLLLCVTMFNVFSDGLLSWKIFLFIVKGTSVSY